MTSKQEKTIALTDLETTGDIPGVHEIIEIGLVVFKLSDFKIIDTLDIKVKPVHIETAVPAALELNGYKEENWKDAISLKEAINQYAEKTQNCVFCSYNVSFDWALINHAFFETGIFNHMRTKENHDRLDLLSIAWERGLKNENSYSLKTACKVFGIPPEPPVHSALNGAMTAYELFKKLEFN